MFKRIKKINTIQVIKENDINMSNIWIEDLEKCIKTVEKINRKHKIINKRIEENSKKKIDQLTAGEFIEIQNGKKIVKNEITLLWWESDDRYIGNHYYDGEWKTYTIKEWKEFIKKIEKERNNEKII